MNMTKEDLKKIAIHCNTEEEALACCELANKLGWTWSYGLSYINNTKWKNEGKYMCYVFNEGTYYDICYCQHSNYTIYSAQWFLDNFKNNQNE